MKVDERDRRGGDSVKRVECGSIYQQMKLSGDQILQFPISYTTPFQHDERIVRVRRRQILTCGGW